MTHGLVPNGYMLEQSDETGQLIVSICAGVGGEIQYLAWNELTGDYVPVDGPNGNQSDSDHDLDDMDGMFCAIAGQVFITASSLVGPGFLQHHYAIYKLPFTGALPLKSTAASPLSARGPPFYS